MIEMTISWEGRPASDFARVFDAAANIDDFRPVLTEVADIIAGSTAKQFDAGGVPPWTPLAPSTISRKARAGASHPEKILVHTGALQKAAGSADSYKITKDELRAAPFSIPYYGFHQTGSGVPQRTVMRLQAEDRTRINKAFADYLRGFMNMNPKTGGRIFKGGS